MTLRMAFDLYLLYLCDVLAHSAPFSRRRVVDDWISDLEQVCRVYPELSARLLEQVAFKSDTWGKGLLIECPTRMTRKRFAELLLLCAECCLVQNNDVSTMVSVQDAASTPAIYQAQNECPKNRVAWLIDLCCTLSSSVLTGGAELFALILELNRLHPSLRNRVISAHGGSRSFAELYSRRVAKAFTSASVNAGSLNAGGLMNASGSIEVYVKPTTLVELVVDLTSNDPASLRTAASEAWTERFVDSAVKMRDFTSACEFGSLVWNSRPNECIDRFLGRLRKDRPITADDYLLISDYFRMFPTQQSLSVVDEMVEIINLSMGDQPDAFPTDDLLNAFRCLGSVLSNSKSAKEHFKNHKKSIGTWPKDLVTAFKMQAKRVEAGSNFDNTGLQNNRVD